MAHPHSHLTGFLQCLEHHARSVVKVTAITTHFIVENINRPLFGKNGGWQVTAAGRQLIDDTSGFGANHFFRSVRRINPLIVDAAEQGDLPAKVPLDGCQVVADIEGTDRVQANLNQIGDQRRDIAARMMFV
jgi:hypothetical protein